MIQGPLPSDSMNMRTGFGCWQLGGNGWKDAQKEESVKAACYAVRRGVRLFDTAPVYGFGESERLLGTVERETGVKLTVATKCGLVRRNGRVTHDLSHDSILSECEQSLERLGRAHIDLYQLHWPDPATGITESTRALCRLLDEGLVKRIGACNFPVDMLDVLAKEIPLTSCQGCFNYIQRDAAKEIIPWCKRHGVIFIAYSVLAQGILTPDITAPYSFTKRDIRRLNPLYTEPSSLSRAVRTRSELGNDPVRGAYDFVLNNGADIALTGTSRTEHVKHILDILP
ncbi:MAG: aldo/keto reductase [Spirochaetota bacterium]